MKTRVVSLTTGGYVPQYWEKYFLWGGRWVGLYEKGGGLWGTYCESTMLDNRVETVEEADRLIERWSSKCLDKRKVMSK